MMVGTLKVAPFLGCTKTNGTFCSPRQPNTTHERDSQQFWLEMCGQISQEQPKLTMAKFSSIFVV
jgi:hypothetical protein